MRGEDQSSSEAGQVAVAAGAVGESAALGGEVVALRRYGRRLLFVTIDSCTDCSQGGRDKKAAAQQVVFTADHFEAEQPGPGAGGAGYRQEPFPISRSTLRVGDQVRVAVGENLIFADTPSPSILKNLLTGEGGAVE